MDSPLRVRDVQEKEVGAARAPTFPTPQPGGFPQPKKRSRFASTFKQQRQAAATAGNTASGPAPTIKTQAGAVLDEKAAIDRENRAHLQGMDAAEIAQARSELLANLDPSLLQILLRRANLDEGSNAEPAPAPAPAAPEIQVKPAETAKPKKTVSFEEPEKRVERETTETAETAKPKRHGDVLLDQVPVPTSLAPISSPAAVVDSHSHDHNHENAASMHFPHAPAVPDLDPADPDFLEHLHAKYFPQLPADPARLAWMAPVPTADSPADRASPYYPGQATVAVAQLRFDFRGRLVPPRASRAIPVSKGLHHHGEAPEAAGYTVGELARLARSAVAAQRCVAFQTLGRLLYRLGRREWGGPGAELALGLWQCLRDGRVLDTLREAAAVEEGVGHRGSRAYAIEAIWLYEKGGWKEQLSGR